MLGSYSNGPIDEFSEKRATISFAYAHLRVDSNNDSEISEVDDQYEDEPGYANLILANKGDIDRDGIPDYADGFKRFDGAAYDTSSGSRFAAMQFCVKPPFGVVGAKIVFDYPDSPPDLVTREVVAVPSIESELYRYHRPEGLRLWTLDGDQSRNLSHFIPSGEEYSLYEFGENPTLYIEAVDGSATVLPITIHLIASDGQVLRSDTVRVLAFDGSSIPTDVAGYEMILESNTGTSGNDIIFAPPGASEIHALGGDDIIVAHYGNVNIFAGDGDDIVFTPRYGHKRIVLEDTVDAGMSLRQGQNGPQRIVSLDDQPFTTEEVLRVYSLMYGQNDPWLALYQQFGGQIEAVEGDGALFSESDWDCVTDPTGTSYVIQLEFDLDHPFIAATHLRQQLLDCCGATFPCGLKYRVEEELVNQLFNTALTQQHLEFDDAVETYEQLREIAFNDAVAGAAAISNAYIASVGIASEGADIVLTLNDLAGGQYASSIALLPYVSSSMISSSKVILSAVGGTATIFMVGNVVRHFPGVSDLGWVMQRDMPKRIGPDNASGRATVILGTGQWTNGDNGFAHAAKCETIAIQWASQGGFEYVLMNRSLHTCTGIDTLGAFAGKRPDVFGVKRGLDGQPILFIREIQSPSQTPLEVTNNLNQITQALTNLGYNVDALPIFLPY